MKLREYLATDPGTYTLAETHTPVTPASFGNDLLDHEVEVYLQGQDAAGRARAHLYVGCRHLVTHLAEPKRATGTPEVSRPAVEEVEVRTSSDIPISDEAKAGASG